MESGVLTSSMLRHRPAGIQFIPSLTFNRFAISSGQSNAGGSGHCCTHPECNKTIIHICFPVPVAGRQQRGWNCGKVESVLN